MATTGSNRNDSGLLPDDSNSETFGGLTNGQNATDTFQANHGPGNHRGSDADCQDRGTDDEVKNGQNFSEATLEARKDRSFISSRRSMQEASLNLAAEKNHSEAHDFRSGIQAGNSGEIAPSARLVSLVNVAGFDANCPPVGKKAKPRKKRELFNLPTSGQDDLKPLMPELPTGYWFECPADDKGFKIKLRWRTGKLKGSYVFKRLGKHEFGTLKEHSNEKRKWFIADRLRGELIRKGKRELAVRIGLITGND